MKYSVITKTKFKAALMLRFIYTELKQHRPLGCSPEHLPRPSPSESDPDRHVDAGPHQHPAVNSGARDCKRRLQHGWEYFHHYSGW